MANTESNVPGKKSVIVAYILWLLGGLFGTHHFYLGRDLQAFVWWTTLGGFGMGWLGDVIRIPRYVREANGDEAHTEESIAKIRQNKKPPFSMNRFTGALMVGYSWGQMVASAVPMIEVGGYNLKFLMYLTPLAVAAGVWAVGNLGREKGSFKWPALAAYAAYPLRYYLYDDTVYFTVMVLAAALAFDSGSKEWRRKPRKQNNLIKRILVIGSCIALYSSLWTSYLYFNGTVTDSEGDEVPVYEALHHFFTSPWWMDVQQSVYDTYSYAQHHGYYETWKQIIDLTDPRGEQNAYKVLELSIDATQQDITASWRRLSRDHHPDKVKDPELRLAAQQHFMEIQQAYDILSSSKHRRNRRNKKDNSEPPASGGAL